MSNTITLIVDNEHDNSKAGRYLRTVAKLSARTLSLLKRTDGGLTVNNTLLRTIDILHTGDVVKINLPCEKSGITPVDGMLDVLYEDEYILVVNKPHNMPVHPVKNHQNNTLANIVAARYKNTDEDFTFRAVNRLDKDTSGIVIIARDRHTATLLQSCDIKKYYTAVCHGIISDSATIDAPIGLKPDSKIVRMVTPDGKPAVTHYEPIRRLRDATVVSLNLETGRTHQIRCHMSCIGHSLYGDDLYGGSVKKIDRQALHCHKVRFEHPFSKEYLEITADIPKDINNLIEDLSGHE